MEKVNDFRELFVHIPRDLKKLPKLLRSQFWDLINLIRDFINKYFLYVFLTLVGILISLILDHCFGCKIIIAQDVKQCTVLGQSAWEWIKLLIGPVIVAITGIILNRFFKIRDNNRLKQEKAIEENRINKDKAIEEDRLRQDSLIKYFDYMTQLILSEEWPEPNESNENTNNASSDIPIIALAKARTFAVLNELDGKRKGSLVIFLHDSKVLHRISMRESNLSEANLYNASLGQINLTDANLRSANFSNANLTDAKLIGADLRGAKLSGTNLSNSNLTDAKLIGANLSNSNISGANLSKANLSGANLRRVIISHATQLGSKWKLVHQVVNEGGKEKDLSNANLNRTDLRGTNFSNAKLGGAKLSGANLSKTNLNKADLRGADLRGANLRGADLRRADLNSAQKITVDQIQKAKNWEHAIYSDDFRKELGLPPIPSPD